MEGVIYIAVINIVNLDDREDIKILPLNQVKKLIHEDQILYHRELEH